MANDPTTDKDPDTDDIDLRPPGLIRYGLSRAIQVHSEEVRAKHPRLALTLDLVEDEQLLADEVVRALYGVYVESLRNALHHGQAGQVKVCYQPVGSEMALKIEDDGRGFDVPADWLTFTRQGKFGLARLRQQVAAAGGKLSVHSQPGGGTTVMACVPLPKGGEEQPAGE